MCNPVVSSKQRDEKIEYQRKRISELERTLREGQALAKKFVWKCENGKARSRETYAECKAFLKTTEQALKEQE